MGVKGLKCAIQYHSKVVNNLDSKLNYQSLKLLRIKAQGLRHWQTTFQGSWCEFLGNNFMLECETIAKEEVFDAQYHDTVCDHWYFP